ncbi:MAG: hypothetical protein H2057_04250 [Alphaproteobacteria bacterium]|nr:hypothetical protein [Alphaproteobacteria bacterium]
MNFLVTTGIGIFCLMCACPIIQASHQPLSFVIEDVQDLTPNKKFTAAQHNFVLTLVEKSRFVQFVSSTDESIVYPHHTYFKIDHPAKLAYISRREQHGPFSLGISVGQTLYNVPLTLTAQDLKEKELRFHLHIKGHNPLDLSAQGEGDYLFELIRIASVQGS